MIEVPHRSVPQFRLHALRFRKVGDRVISRTGIFLWGYLCMSAPCKRVDCTVIDLSLGCFGVGPQVVVWGVNSQAGVGVGTWVLAWKGQTRWWCFLGASWTTWDLWRPLFRPVGQPSEIAVPSLPITGHHHPLYDIVCGTHAWCIVS